MEKSLFAEKKGTDFSRNGMNRRIHKKGNDISTKYYKNLYDNNSEGEDKRVHPCAILC